MAKNRKEPEKRSVEVPVERAQVQALILFIRGRKVILDRDLAALYQVETKALKQAVRRNAARFPEDSAFVLDRQEFADLRSQIVTSSSANWGGVRHAPMAFTEQGIAMLSSVLRSERAVEVNIAIMRTFVNLRNMIEHNADLGRRIDDMERKVDEQFRIVFEVLGELIAEPDSSPKQIGFHVKEVAAPYRSKKKRS